MQKVTFNIEIWYRNLRKKKTLIGGGDERKPLVSRSIEEESWSWLLVTLSDLWSKSLITEQSIDEIDLARASDSELSTPFGLNDGSDFSSIGGFVISRVCDCDGRDSSGDAESLWSMAGILYRRSSFRWSKFEGLWISLFRGSFVQFYICKCWLNAWFWLSDYNVW